MTGYAGGQAPKERRGFFDVERRLKELFDKIAEITSSDSPVDHGALTGLTDDDHGQYALADGSRGAFDPLGASTAAAAAAQAYAVSEDENRETVREAAEAALETSLEAYADQAEADAITTANSYTDAEVATETAARISADNAEAAARGNADAALQTAIDDEESARIAGDALKVNRAGDTMTGDLLLTGNSRRLKIGNGTFPGVEWLDASNVRRGLLYLDTTANAVKLATYNSSGVSLGDALTVSTTTGHVVTPIKFSPAIGDKIVLYDGGAGAEYKIGISPATIDINTGSGATSRVRFQSSGTSIGQVNSLGFSHPAAAPTAADHLTRKDYVDGRDDVIQAALDAHVDDAVDAHDATAISYNGTTNSAIVQAWLTASELNTAVGQLAGQLYTPDAETTEALIAALNALAIADPDTEGITNPDLFSSDLIVARHIASGSVTTVKLDAQAVTTATIAAGAVTADRIAAGTITATEIDATSIRGAVLTADSITAGMIASGTIVADDIAANTITAGQIAADAITASELAADSVAAENIIAGTITADEIASGAITTVKLDANAVTAGKLATDAITSTNYIAPPDPDDYSIQGSYFNLANGDIQTPGLLVRGATGDLSVKGEIEADALIINKDGVEAAKFFTSTSTLWSRDVGFSFQYPDVEAARTRGVAGEAGAALGASSNFNDKEAQFGLNTSTYSELSGGDSYQQATASIDARSDIDSGLATLKLAAGGVLYAPAGSGASQETSIVLSGFGEGYSGGVKAGVDVFGGPLRAIGGSATSPAFSFTSDPDTGVYSVGSNSLGFSTGGSQRMYLNSGGMKVQGGSSAAPSIAFSDDTNTGFYSHGSDQLGIATAGVTRAIISSTQAIFAGLSCYAAQKNAGAPSWSFENDANTGMFWAAADTIGFSTAGIEQARITTSGRMYTVQYLTYSDRRLKGDVEPFADGLELVKKLNPVTYRRRWAEQRDAASPFEFSEPTGERRAGLIADEVEGVAPWAVEGEATESELQSVDYATLVVPLIAAVQELASRVEALEKKVKK